MVIENQFTLSCTKAAVGVTMQRCRPLAMSIVSPSVNDRPAVLKAWMTADGFGTSATIDIDLRKCCRFITDGDDSGAGKKPKPSSH